MKRWLAVRYITATFIRSEIKQTDQIKVFLYGKTVIFAFVVFTALVWRERVYPVVLPLAKPRIYTYGTAFHF